jgi:hypothetical protein
VLSKGEREVMLRAIKRTAKNGFDLLGVLSKRPINRGIGALPVLGQSSEGFARHTKKKPSGAMILGEVYFKGIFQAVRSVLGARKTT